jgi:hypothetical protein
LYQWLNDEAGQFTVTLFEDLFNRIEAGHLARRVGQPERAAIAIGRVGFDGGEQQRLEPRMELLDVAYADGADGIAVVGQF